MKQIEQNMRPRSTRRRSPLAGLCCACLLPALSATAPAQQPAPPLAVPSAVPPSAPTGTDPGSIPSVPIFGPHSMSPASPDSTVAIPPPETGDRIPPPPSADRIPPPPTGDPNAPRGIQQGDIRAYVIPEADLTPVQTEPGGVIWERNASLAFHKAKTLQRPLLLLFTASWNSLCQKLSEEVFASKTFNTFAKENCVICFVDYPQNLNHAAESMIQVREKYRIRGYPNLLVFDPDGNVVQQVTGYREGRPVAYYNKLFAIVDPLCIHLRDRKEQLIEEGYRDWTDHTGTTVFARFESHNREKVLLNGPAGDRWIFPLTTLAPADQALVQSFPTFAELHPEAVSEQDGGTLPGR